MLLTNFEETNRGGLVVRSQSRRAPGSKPGSAEDPLCNGPVARLIIHRWPNVLLMVWCGSLDGDESSDVVLVIWPLFEITKSVQNTRSVVSKRDVNINKQALRKSVHW
ncbi:hypothetical protein AVEN_77063-1 [Araneus ventricosus]|uniref:Uncharacterized protein n=1 Tax=Araneus ventricosus TaxID=182803 RepID=A0A4Y2G5X1_ARAVE|nr:hypothetical protein AVEN_77063-1 [Araneus ventricosus]